MRRDLDGGDGPATNRGQLQEPPGPAGAARLQQEVEVATGGIVGGVGVFEQREAGHPRSIAGRIGRRRLKQAPHQQATEKDQ